jgi:hypothetical protein
MRPTTTRTGRNSEAYRAGCSQEPFAPHGVQRVESVGANASSRVGTINTRKFCPMFSAAILSVVLVVLTAFVHYEALRRLNDALPHIVFVARRAKVLVAMLGAIGSHVLHIALFAAAYYFLRDSLGLGGLGGQFHDVFSSYLYFSAETYTSLGFGDIYPLGQIRMVVGIEALTGLLMISWTASFTYFEMSRYWKNR